MLVMSAALFVWSVPAQAVTRSVSVVPKIGVFATSSKIPITGRATGLSRGTPVRIVKISGAGSGVTGVVGYRGYFRVTLTGSSTAGVTYYRAVVGGVSSARFSIRVAVPAISIASKPAVLQTDSSGAITGSTIAVPVGTTVTLARVTGTGPTATAKVRFNGTFVVAVPARADAGDTQYRLVAGRARSAAFMISVLEPFGAPGTGETQVVTPAKITSSPAPGTAGTLTFAAGIAAPSVGDAIAAGVGPTTPNGLLVRVTGVEVVNGSVRATTVPARLDEVLPSGRAAPTITVNRLSAASSTPLRSTSPTTAGYTARTADRSVACTGSSSFVLKATTEVSATLNPVLEWGITSPDKVGLVANASASAHAEASASLAGSCTLNEIELLDRKLTPVTVMAGPVPVVFVPELEVSLDGSIEASSQTGASVDAGIAAKAGLMYENGVTSPVADITPTFDHTIIPPSANATATATLHTTISVLVYGAAGPEVALNSGLQLGADTTKTPSWWLDAPVSAHALLDVPVLGISTPSIELYSRAFRLAEAETPVDQTAPWSGTLHRKWRLQYTNSNNEGNGFYSPTSVRISRDDSVIVDGTKRPYFESGFETLTDGRVTLDYLRVMEGPSGDCTNVLTDVAQVKDIAQDRILAISFDAKNGYEVSVGGFWSEPVTQTATYCGEVRDPSIVGEAHDPGWRACKTTLPPNWDGMTLVGHVTCSVDPGYGSEGRVVGTDTVESTWRLTRHPDADHDGYPDTSDVCPDSPAPPDSLDGCP